MNSWRLVARLCAVLGFVVPLLAPAQNIVFNDSFTADALNAATYPAVTTTSTGWNVASNKAAPAPTESGGILTLNMASTTSGFVETQALFSAAPVQLLPNTYLELTATFVPTYVVTNTSDNLVVGLFNSGGSAPASGMLSSQLTSSLSNFASGGAKGWLGFNANLPLTGATAKMLTRPAQSGTTNVVQDVLFDGQSSSVGYANSVTLTQTTTPSTTFTNGSTYTIDYKLALSADGATLTATCSLYNGVGTTGTGSNTLVKSYSGTATGANVLTKAFDAMAIGWRADAGNPSNIKLSSLTVRTTGGAPWFTTQPPPSLLASIGSDLSITTAVNGVVSSYLWQKSTDNGATFTNLDATANATAATATLTLSGIQAADAGVYRLVATNAAGASTSTSVTVSVTNSPVAPTIVTPPVSGTVLAGTPFTFTAVVNGTSPLSYQWSQSTDGVTYTPINGATSASYTINAPTVLDEGSYELTVTNVVGSVTTAPATLTVNQPLTIATQPAGATLHLGDSYTLTALALGKPAPTYQWYLNGTALGGATAASYTIPSAGAANAGLYTVVASNTTGDSVPSDAAAITVLSSTLAATALTPVTTATGIKPDTRLTLTFNQPIAIGLSGQIRIYDAANPTVPVDTIDIAADLALMKSLRAGSSISTQALPVQTKTIGGLTNFHYYPITLSGNTATIYPTNKALTYAKTYFVTIDAGVFTDTSGLSFAGFTGASSWTFATAVVGPATNATRITVAADGSGDFYTVQGALDSIPSGNTTPRTIFVRKGTYFEQVYFSGKNAITLLGEDRAATVIAYPNNNTFNNVSGSYHRMVFQADHVSDFTLLNLTIQNTTPKGGSQAEALVLNGTTTARAIVANVNLLSYQDTLLANGQAYLTDSHISGDVDYMWGNGPNFFNACQLTALTSGGYFTQIRNGSSGHGNVYLNCTLDAPASVTGMYLARIDPTSANFPYSEVVWLNCVMGTVSGSTYSTPVSPAGWLLNNTPDQTAASAPNVHFWEYNSHYSDGTPLNVSSRIGASRQLTLANDAATITNYSTPSYVLGGWTPQFAPVIAAQPVAQTVDAGAGLTLSVQAFGIPTLTYQWLYNGTPIGGATSATYAVGNVAGVNAGNYAVVVSNGSTSVMSATVPVVVHGGPPVIARAPTSATALRGTTATFNVWALGDGPLSYQWSKDGAPIAGATRQSLRLLGLQDSDAASYSVAVSNAGGTTLSSAATLALATPATTLPVQPTIPAGIFDVTAYGAVGDGATDNTAAIQAAINAANAAGGGTIEIPAAPAAYLCGPITLSSNTNVQVDGGAVLQALPFGTYPKSYSAPAHFITIASGSANVEFSGSGVIEGNGAAWWAAYDAGLISNRPRLVQITKATNLLFSGLTFQNSPNFHLAFSGLNNNVTLFGVTITAPGDSPNTDGMDLSGTNFLVQHCSVSVGDDNIVAKPGSVFCRNLYIADCAIGTGHGVSVGGQTNVGLDGMVVTNCTFNGTDTGLRLKADPTQGGPVRNVTYSNITMTNVTYPILFYSYYNQLGSPGAKSGSSQTTPAKVNAWNATPPNSLASSTIPSWQNITVTNLTATGAGGYSTLWGLPLANGLVSAVTFNNVSISGGAGLELYDAANVQLTGTNSIGPILTANALAITGQPQGTTINVGDTVTFNVTAVGASGTTPQPSTYRWALNGTPLTDGPQIDGSNVSGATTSSLTITNARVTGAGSYTATVANTLDGFDTTTNALVPNSLPVSATSSPAMLVVNPLPASITLSNLSQTYTGTPESPTVTTSPAGIPVKLTYAGGATPLNAGSYTVTASIADPNYVGVPVTAPFTIAPASATLTLANLSQPYDGQPKTVTATTSPADLPVNLTYNGASAGPVYPGQYPVIATIADPNYTGTTNGTLTITVTALVRHAPTLNGGVDGSVQVLSPESLTLNGNAWLSCDLLVPGTPALVVNGQPLFAGTKTGPDGAEPSNYTVTLNGGAVLRYLVRQVDAPALPAVATPPRPTGTRTVTLNSAKQDPGDFATIANLTLNGNAGDVALPAGTYGQLAANGGSGFVLGHAGATQPDVYNIQTLVLNGEGHIGIVGPVLVVLANGVTLNGTVGDPAHPEWLKLAVANGGLTLNGNAQLYGFVVAPRGAIDLNGSSTLTGEITADRLTLSGTAVLSEP